MSRARRSQPLWCRGWGEAYHRDAPSPLPCATGGEKKHEICVMCAQELQNRGVKMWWKEKIRGYRAPSSLRPCWPLPKFWWLVKPTAHNWNGRKPGRCEKHTIITRTMSVECIVVGAMHWCAHYTTWGCWSGEALWKWKGWWTTEPTRHLCSMGFNLVCHAREERLNLGVPVRRSDWHSDKGKCWCMEMNLCITHPIFCERPMASRTSREGGTQTVNVVWKSREFRVGTVWSSGFSFLVKTPFRNLLSQSSQPCGKLDLLHLF